MASRPHIKDANLFFFDSETGGLSPASSDMIEVACIVTDPTGLTVQAEYCAKVIPERPVSPEAARINGYTQEKWAAEAITLDAAMVRMLKMAQNTLFTAHNTPFDWGFFEHAMAKRGMRWPSNYHRIDTVALAFPLLRAGMVPNLKLTTLTEYFNIPHDDAHTALSDARACRGVYLKIMERYAPLFEKE